MAISTQRPDERRDSLATHLSPTIPVGSHTQATVPAGQSGLWIPRPGSPGQPGQEATFINVFNSNSQVNIRYRIDDGQADPTLGFRIGSGVTSLIAVAGRGISIASEGAAVTIEYQWLV